MKITETALGAASAATGGIVHRPRVPFLLTGAAPSRRRTGTTVSPH